MCMQNFVFIRVWKFKSKIKMSLEKNWFNGKEKKGWVGFDLVIILKVSLIFKIIK